MAKNIATGALWKIGAVGVARSYSGRCSTLERSTTVSAKAGAEGLRSSTRSASGPCHWHYFPLIGNYPSTPLVLACKSDSKRWNSIGLVSGEPAGASCHLYEQLGLDAFWAERLPDSREGTCWQHILQTLVCYRLMDPGSEWRLHRQWFERSAMGDLLDEDYSLVEKNALYRCLDRVLKHKEGLFSHLSQRWQDLFGARFEVLLYDLTSTYFESDPPFEEPDKRQFGYSRDKRSDCVQVVIGLIVTPEGFPLAYEVLAGNTSDKTTLRQFLRKIEEQYGKAERIWVMDRGVPTEEVLNEMRSSVPPVYYLVGTPKGRLSKLEANLLDCPWQSVRAGVEVKVLPQENELYVLAQSRDRLNKERAMRRHQLKALWKRLAQLKQMKITARTLLLKLGEAKGRYPAAWRLIDLQLPDPKAEGSSTFGFGLNRQKLRQVRRREGRYLLRTNLCGRDPAQLWQFYIQLVEIEAAFKNLKDDLVLRPIFHQLEHRIEAHIFIAFMAYCLHLTLRARLRPLAPGLTPRAVLDKFAAIQMLDVHFPTTDGRTSDLEPLHPPRARSQNPARTTQPHATGSTTTANQFQRQASK
jgi:transposase